MIAVQLITAVEILYFFREINDKYKNCLSGDAKVNLNRAFSYCKVF